MTSNAGVRKASARRTSNVESALEATAPATSRRQQAPAAYAPGAKNRRNAKVLDSGARTEEKIVNTMVRKLGIDAWRLPGVRVSRHSGDSYSPDGAAYLPELAGLVVEQTPQIAGRPNYNVLFEIKSQRTSGSAKSKIPTAVVDLAHAADRLGVPAVMVLHTPVLSDQQIRAFKVEGRLHSVVVLTDEELNRSLLVSEVTRVAKERRRLAHRLGPRGGYTASKKPPVFERGLALRIAQRHHTGRRLIAFGAVN